MIPSHALAAVSASELARAATMFTTIKQLRLRVSSIEESILDEAFETHVQSVLEKLDERLPNIEDSTVREAEVLMAKHGLFDAAFQQAILLCHTVFPALGDSLKDIRSVHSSFVAEFYRIIDDTQHTFADLIDRSKQQQDLIDSLTKDVGNRDVRIKILDKEAEELRNYIEDLRKELRDANTEIDNQRETMKVLSQNPPPAPSTSSKLNNSNMTQTGYKPFVFSLEDMSSTPNNPNRRPSTPTITGTPVSRGLTRSNSHGNIGNNANNQTGENAMPKLPAKYNSLQSKYNFTKHPSTWLYNFRSEMQIYIDGGKCRELSIKECKDMIEKFYESKSMANEKAIKGMSQYPSETMEQHVYRLYEKKFGLRTLAVEQAGKLLMGIQNHQFEDNYITVFYKIFKNEIEEDFRLVQQELLRSIYDLIMIQLVARFPTKDQKALQQLFDKKTKSTINEEEWTDMMNYLYDENDSIAICLILKMEAKRELEDKYEEEQLQQINSSAVSQFVHNEISDRLRQGLLGNNQTNFSHEDDGLSFLSTPTKAATNRNNQDNSMNNAVIVKNITKVNPSLNSKGFIHPPADILDKKRLGYSSPSMKSFKSKDSVGNSNNPSAFWGNDMQSPTASSIKSQSPRAAISSQIVNNKLITSNKSTKSNLKLSFDKFIKCILDFQLSSHERYLHSYREVFHEIDADRDGILNIREFFQCYSIIRNTNATSSFANASNDGNQGLEISMARNMSDAINKDFFSSAAEELDTFATIVRLIDPMETDIITFSASATALSKVGMKMNKISTGKAADETMS